MIAQHFDLLAGADIIDIDRKIEGRASDMEKLGWFL